MEKENNVNKSIPQQIIEETFGVIRRQQIFNKEIIENLEELWSSSGLKSAEDIIKAIKPASES